MDLENQVAPLIKNDFIDQNITRLRSWFESFPNAAEMLEKELGSPVITYAIREVKWLSLVFILSVPNVKSKSLQSINANDSEFELCLLIVKSNMQKLHSTQVKTLNYLHERVRL
jgi:hypothetical protein